MSERRTWLAFLTVIAAWGSSYLFIKLSVASFTPVGLVAVRFGLAALLCALIGRVRNEVFPSGMTAVKFALVGMLMMTGSNALTAYAQATVSSGIAGVTHSLGSVWLAALGSLGAFGVSNTRTPPLAWIGVGSGVAGVAVLLWPTEGQAHAEVLGVGALLLATVLFAGASVLQRRTQASAKVGLFPQLAAQMAGGSLLAWLLVPFFGMTHAPLETKALAAIAVLTLVSSVAGFAGYAIVLANWPPARAGSFGVINPVVAMILGVLVLNEPLTQRGILGAVLVLASVAWVQWITSRAASVEMASDAA